MECYYVWWPWLTSNATRGFVSISWTSCWTTYTKFDNCCLCYIATCGNFFLYRCTYTFSALNYCGGIFFKSLSYLYEVVHTNFSADFWTFRNFWPQFAKIVAPAMKMRIVYCIWKSNPLWKTSENLIEIGL